MDVLCGCGGARNDAANAARVSAAGAFASERALAYLPLVGAFGRAEWPKFNETQFACALLMFLGIAVAGADRWFRGADVIRAR